MNQENESSKKEKSKEPFVIPTGEELLMILYMILSGINENIQKATHILK